MYKYILKSIFSETEETKDRFHQKRTYFYPHPFFLFILPTDEFCRFKCNPCSRSVQGPRGKEFLQGRGFCKMT